MKRENPQDPPLCRQVSITATAIEGRLTALLIYQDAIKLSVGGINQTLVVGVAILTEIRDNTAYCRRLEQIESGIGSMKRELETINSRGGPAGPSEVWPGTRVGAYCIRPPIRP